MHPLHNTANKKILQKMKRMEFLSNINCTLINNVFDNVLGKQQTSREEENQRNYESLTN